MPDSHHELRAEDLGARLRAVRELSGADQRDVAQAAGLSRRELQAAERGAKTLTDDELDALAGALGVDTDVLVGVGFEGELRRAATDDEAPSAGSANLPNPERRKDYNTRNVIEQSWRDVRAEMGDALTSCARLISAGSGDDVRRLIERLERDLQELTARRTFQRNLADHERELNRARRPQTASLPSDRISTRL